MELPATSDAAGRNPFVFTLVYKDASGDQVRLAQQPAGLNIAIFPDWQTCKQTGQVSAGPCIAWGAFASSFLLSSDSAPSSTLQAFQRAIGPWRPSS